jgi:hypothetical protein
MLCAAILSCAIALGPQGAQGAPGAPGAQGASDAPGAWRIDAGLAVMREAWDFNESTESLAGFVGGMERRVWRGLSLRGELLALRVMQAADDAWLRGFTVGARQRWGQGRIRPLLDAAVGLSSATRPVPPRGTTFNYLAVIGAGVEAPFRSAVVFVTGRWLHASNNGRAGRQRNPDTQALGAVVSVGWEY